MEKQTKNMITREIVEKELSFYNTADIRSALVLCSTLSLLFIPLTAGIIYGLFALLKNIWLMLPLAILIGGLMSAPVWINLLSLIRSLKERNLLQNGDFDIEICEVQYKYEKLVHRHTEKFLHFSGFEDISLGNANFDLTSQGDKFYIVHYKDRTTIKLIYSLKMYEYS